MAETEESVRSEADEIAYLNQVYEWQSLDLSKCELKVVYEVNREDMSDEDYWEAQDRLREFGHIFVDEDGHLILDWNLTCVYEEEFRARRRKAKLQSGFPKGHKNKFFKTQKEAKAFRDKVGGYICTNTNDLADVAYSRERLFSSVVKNENDIDPLVYRYVVGWNDRMK